MRDPTSRGPAIDLSEFERRLRGGEPSAGKPKVDPLSELARLMQGEQDRAPGAADPYESVLGESASREGASRENASWEGALGRGPATARAQRPPAPHPDADDDFAAELRGAFGHDTPDIAPQAGDYRGSAYREADYDPRSYQPSGSPPADYRDPAAYGEESYGPGGDYSAPPAAPHDATQAYPHGQPAYPHGDDYYAHPDDYSDAARYQPQEADAAWDDATQSYLDYGREEADARDYGDDYGDDGSAAAGAGRRWPKLRPWHAVAAVAAIGLVSIGWGFAHRGGNAGPHDVPTINAPEGPVKAPPDVEAQQGVEGQGASVLERKEAGAVKQVVTHEEQPLDPKTAPRAVPLGAGPVDAPNEAGPAGPRKVKTISVRPDGTVIENDAPPPAATGGADAVEPPAPAAPPKSAAKPAAQAKPKPAKTAAVEEDAVDAGAAPARDSGGGYAVQFGAAGSEAEARGLLTKVAKQYASSLGGRRPTFKPAKVDGKTVYRVRVAGMSKDAATAMCEKVKASGGNCFVAGN